MSMFHREMALHKDDSFLKESAATSTDNCGVLWMSADQVPQSYGGLAETPRYLKLLLEDKSPIPHEVWSFRPRAEGQRVI